MVYNPTSSDQVYVTPVSNGVLSPINQPVSLGQVVALANSGSLGNEILTTINTVGAGTLTAASIIGRNISRTGTQVAAFTDTTDTAANIIAALPSADTIGFSWKVTYTNNTTYPATITGGTGVTVSGFNVIEAGNFATFLVTYNGTGTITMVGLTGGGLATNIGIGSSIGGLASGSFSQASSITLNPVTGLSVNLIAGASYQIDGYLAVTNNSTGGITLKFGGTATATQLVVDTQVFNTTTLTAETNITALSSNLVNAAVAATLVFITGTIIVNASGTLIIQAAQNTSNATPLTVTNGSYLSLTRLA